MTDHPRTGAGEADATDWCDAVEILALIDLREIMGEMASADEARAELDALLAQLTKRDEERDRLKALLRGAADRIDAVEFPLFRKEVIDAARVSADASKETSSETA